MVGHGTECLRGRGKNPLQTGHFMMHGRKGKQPKLVKEHSNHCTAEVPADNNRCVPSIQLAQRYTERYKQYYHKCIDS